MVKSDDLKMYFDRDVVREFVERENNPKYVAVTRIIELLGLKVLKDCDTPWRVADLGAGAHPEHYMDLYKLLMRQVGGKLYWVDISPVMLEVAKKTLESEPLKQRLELTDFVEADMLDFLSGLSSEYLNLILMKYTFDHVSDLDRLFEEIYRGLRKGGGLVANLGVTDGKLPSVSHNARFLIRGEEFPIGETRILRDGDQYMVKFLKSFGDVSAGYLDGAEVTKYYYSPEYICDAAEKQGLKCWIGDWRDYDKEINQDYSFDVDIVVLRK